MYYFINNDRKFAPWLQVVVFVDFKANMKLNILLDIITACEEHQAKVRAVVMDNGNHGIMRDLGFHKLHNWFSNPVRKG